MKIAKGSIFRIITTCVVFLICLINFFWISKYRLDGYLNIDEAGYIAQAVSFARALVGGGVLEWIKAISLPSAFAPLLPIFTSIFLSLFGIDVNNALIVNAVIYGILLIVVYCFARVFSSYTLSLISVCAVASLPVLLEYSRNYSFVLATTLFYTLTLFAYVKSDGFRNRYWSLLIGLSLALMTLSRTMALSFLPIFAFVFFVTLCFEKKLNDKKVMMNVLLSCLAFMICASSWYITHFDEVWKYLFSYAYGKHSEEYSKLVNNDIFNILKLRLTDILEHLGLVNTIIFIPIFLFQYIISIFQIESLKKFTLLTTQSRASQVSTICLLSFAILATTKNHGTAFDSPILPVVILYSVSFFEKFKRAKYVLLVVVLINLTMIFATKEKPELCQMSAIRMGALGLPGLEAYRCVDINLAYIIEALKDDSGRLPFHEFRSEIIINQSKLWPNSNTKVTDHIAKLTQNKGTVVFASRNMLLNVNTVSLEEIVKYGMISPKTQIDPILIDDQKSLDEWLLSDSIQNSCVMATFKTNDGEFKPYIKSTVLYKSLHATGYKLVDSIETPVNRNTLDLWQSNRSNCQLIN